jgi:hypothetical protein
MGFPAHSVSFSAKESQKSSHLRACRDALSRCRPGSIRVGTQPFAGGQPILHSPLWTLDWFDPIRHRVGVVLHRPATGLGADSKRTKCGLRPDRMRTRRPRGASVLIRHARYSYALSPCSSIFYRARHRPDVESTHRTVRLSGWTRLACVAAPAVDSACPQRPTFTAASVAPGGVINRVNARSLGLACPWTRSARAARSVAGASARWYSANASRTPP